MSRHRKPRVDLPPEDAAALARLYEARPEITTAELAERFGLARASVSAIVRRHGVRLRIGPPRMPLEEVDRIVAMYRNHSLRVHEIAEMVGRDRATIHRLVKQLLPATELRGMGRYPDRWRRYGYRPDVFADPLSDDELWLLGLLLADGSTDGVWRVVLRLAESDRDCVETARRVAGSEAPIKIWPSCGTSPSGGPSQDLAGWTLDSREVVARLSRLGMRPAKSYRTDVTVPTRVASSPSFWRGLIDGDGTVCWNRSTRADGRERRTAWVQVLGAETLLRQWASFITETIGGPAPRVRRKQGTRVLHVSVLSGSRAWHVLKLLYDAGGPALARKRAAALAILAEDPPTPKPLSRADVEHALVALGGRALAGLPVRYVCPGTGMRLGKLVHKARRGQRADLHPLFMAYDPNWRSPIE